MVVFSPHLLVQSDGYADLDRLAEVRRAERQEYERKLAKVGRRLEALAMELPPHSYRSRREGSKVLPLRRRLRAPDYSRWLVFRRETLRRHGGYLCRVSAYEDGPGHRFLGSHSFRVDRVPLTARGRVELGEQIARAEESLLEELRRSGALPSWKKSPRGATRGN